MKNVWKWSTAIFVGQMLVFAVASYGFYLSGPRFFGLPHVKGSLYFASIVVIVGSFINFLFLAHAKNIRTNYAAFLAAASSLAATSIYDMVFGALVIEAEVVSRALVLAMGTLIFIFAVVLARAAAVAAKRAGASEPLWALTLAAMPAGIGMVLGGILLFFGYPPSRSVTA